MLIPDFYSIEDLQDSASKIIGRIKLNPKHEVYQGHFPDQPIVPGVIQLQIMKELVEVATGQKFLIGEMLSAKYLNLIVPEKSAKLSFEIDYQKSGEQLKISAIIKEKELVFTKVKARLTFT